MLECIDIALCATLDKRLNDALALQASGKKLGIDIDLIISGNGLLDIKYDIIDSNDLPPKYPNSIKKEAASWWTRPNNYNAWKSHRTLFKKALDTNCKILLMLEDDAQFEKDFLPILNQSSPFLKETKWDLCYLGAYVNQYNSVPSIPTVLKLLNGGGTHGVLIKRNILEWAVTLPPLGPFDWIFSLVQPQLNVYCINPSIITQKSGFSYIENSILNKPNRYIKKV